MADRTKIEWSDATWNPITGCSVLSPGCTNCYAMKLAGGRLRHDPTRAGLTRQSRGGPVWTGEVRFNESMLDLPLRWKRPRKIFVCAHGDLFHENVPFEWIDRVYAVMALCPQHTFQVLTKRPQRMLDYLINGQSRHGVARQALKHTGRRHPGGHDCDPEVCNATFPLPNVWLGVSVENQAAADERIPLLLAAPAAVRWISAEPLLGPVSLRWTDYAHRAQGLSYRQYLERTGSINEYEALRKIDWVVVGGESGHGARPMHPDWVRRLRDQCADAGVAFLFKQWGNFHITTVGPKGNTQAPIPLDANFGKLQLAMRGTETFLRPAPETTVDIVFAEGNVIAVPGDKRQTGRTLDGALHDGYPEVRHG